ncbi:HIT-like protein [Thelephora terrestris]|uniref:HIT-like protein n=1 Tax=Thelephora terrestris TaxID=56493 RepID=A0A9P6H3L9_9AGAM|nr:HIT-like protein [Thelephora terrestris]
MTSFIVEAHVGRVVRPEWAGDPQCAFCSILQKKLPAYILYEDEKVISILDIAPLRLGHTLVIPKVHLKHISELPEDYAAALGLAVTRVAKALTKFLENPGLNVVGNQEYAQAVPHVHYHIIPAPQLDAPRGTGTYNALNPPTEKEMHRMELEGRTELDEDFAKEFSDRIRRELSATASSHL